MLSPRKINRTENNSLQILWNDDSTSEINIKLLRDECPCVHCKGESVIFESYIPLKAPFKAPGFYEIDKLEVMGNYAMHIIWKDGHNTGIYSWDMLKELGEKNN